MLHGMGKLLILPGNIRLRRKGLPVTNTLAYYTAVSITAEKSSIAQTREHFTNFSLLSFKLKLFFYKNTSFTPKKVFIL